MNALLIKVRSVARKMRLTRLYHELSYRLSFRRKDYEEKFHDAMLTELRPGDIVWDIGANRGFYTQIFCEKVGAEGEVIAFEPTPEVYLELCSQTGRFKWVRNEQKALSDFDGTALFLVGSEYSRGNHLNFSEPATGMEGVEVEVLRGDSYWKQLGKTPNLIKIDVEGFEEEVIIGSERLLSAPELRGIFVEVHFNVLERRGRAMAPARIEKTLRGKGFQPKWVDRSHIVALRKFV
jgi:FkbM family methyltransferase